MARRPAGKQVRADDGTLIGVRGRAANGAGSIYRDGSSYRATYRDLEGKLRRVSGRTKAEAAARRDEKVAALDASRAGELGDDPTVAQMCDWWLDHIGGPRVGDGTRHTYRTQLNRVAAKVGTRPMRSIDREASVLLVEHLAAKYARNTVAKTISVWRQVVDEAIEHGLLRRDPTRHITIPQCQPGKALRFLTVEEVRTLVGVLDGTGRWDSAVALCYLEGLRVSEALGLAWGDIDWDRGIATVRRACTDPGGGAARRLGPTKTRGALGPHDLAPTTLRLLRARRVQQAEERLAQGDEWPTWIYRGETVDLVHTHKDGALPARQRVYDAITDACVRAGLDPAGAGTHTGRRSVITALAEDEDLDDVARYVGHAQTSTTAGYVQSYGERPARVAARAHALLDPAAGR